MNQTLALGPLVVPIALLLGIAAFTVADAIARRLDRDGAKQAERQLLRILLAGLLAARVAFVLQFGDAYLKAPWTMFDIRDGGWRPAFGFAVAAAYAGVLLVRRPVLRRPLSAALGAGASLWIAGAIALQAAAPQDARLPALTLETVAGQRIALASFQGQPTVVNLWATWCPPCQREMPVLQQAQARHAGIHFVFLNQGEAPDKVLRYLAASRLQLRNVLLDARGEAGAQLGHRALPTTLFFDAQGRLVDTRVGELSEASLAERLQSISPPPSSR